MRGNYPLTGLQLVGPLLCLNRLIERLQLGLLVLQHAHFRSNPCVQVEGGLLITCMGDCVNQLL